MTIDKDALTVITQVAQVLRNKHRLLFITGAGISADSGLPTYRGVGGLYEGNLTKDGLSIEEALSGDVFRQNPQLTWKYLAQIEESCRNATFNAGHRIIAELEQFFEVVILTQNVDGFHDAAGSRNVIDIHGNLHYLECMRCSYSDYVENYTNLVIPPQCPQCSGLLRPQVVLFGEALPEDRIYQLVEEMRHGFDVVFSIGTTSVFPYISQPVIVAKQRGVPTVEINPADTYVSWIVDYKIRAGAAESLSALWDHFRSDKN